MKKFNILIVALAVLALMITACQQVPTGPGPVPNNNNNPGQIEISQAETFSPTEEAKTSNFKSDAEYLAFLKSHAAGANNYYGGSMLLSRSAVMESAMPVAAPSAGKMVAYDSASGNGGADYSVTNNQVATVDEADIIKTDGEYIYTVSGSTLFIVKAYPGEDAEIISETKFKQQPQGLFVKGDKLAVFGYFYDTAFFKEMGWRPRSGMTYFNIYDISDKEKPTLEKEFKFEGSYFQSRMKDDYVYFVTTQSPEYRRDYPTPLMFEGNVKRAMPVDNIYYFNIPYGNVQLANINSINLDDMTLGDSKSVAVEYGQNMYMSDDNIFITYTEQINEWELQHDIMLEIAKEMFTEEDKKLAEKIMDSDNDILSEQEKKSKIMQMAYDYINWLDEEEQQKYQDKAEELLKAKLAEYEYFEYTIINKVSVNGGKVKVEANGKVPGHVLNQFSMDEQDGVLRIATTLNARWNNWIAQTDDAEADAEAKLSSNNIFTLDEDLKVLDSKKGIAKGEQIYSTRFMGDRLYMVTFRQVDPFFVFDLSDPKDITELGKLKIPGFSRYLHPYDENTIIGIGRDTNLQGSQEGLKISLFDVSDVENPKEVAKFVTASDYAQSIAEYEHKAFLFNKEKELLVIPAYSYSYNKCFRAPCPESSSGFNGAMVFKITKDEIKMRGVIDHSQGQQYYGQAVERSLFIEELLYTKSMGLLRINKLDDLSKVKNIELSGGDSVYPVY